MTALHGQQPPRGPSRLGAAESDANLWGALAAARGALQEGRADDARERARGVLRLLDTATPTRSLGERRAAQGAAETIVGLVAEGAGHADDARQAFRRALGAFGAAGEQSTRGVVVFCHGVALLHAERAVEAEAALRRAFELGEDTIDQRRYLGLALHAQHRDDEAFAALREAVDRAPHDRAAWAALAMVADRLDRPTTERARLWLTTARESLDADDLERALDAARRAHALDPTPTATLLLARLEARAGDGTAAAALVDGLGDDLETDDAMARVDVLLSLGRGDQAAAALAAIDVERDRLAWKSDVLLDAGRFADALVAADALAAAGLPALRRRARALQGLGRLDAAVDAARAAVDEEPGAVDAFVVLADALLATEDVPGAAAALDSALALAPDDVGLRTWRERLRAETGDLATADRALYALSLEHPGDAYIQATFGVVLRREEQYPEAAEQLERAAQAAPHVAWVWYELAGTYQSLGRADDHVAALEHVVALEPRDVGARLELAEAIVAHVAPERPERAAELLRALVDEVDDEEHELASRVHAARGEHHRRFGDQQDALAELDIALTHDAENGYARGTRGQILVAQGRLDDGIADLELAQSTYLRRGNPRGQVPTWLLAELADAYLARFDQSSTPEHLESAEQALRLLLRQSPSVAARWTSLARLVRLRRDPAGVEHVLTQALDAGAQPAATLLRELAEHLRGEQRSAEALARARDATTADPDDVYARFTYGSILLDVGQFDEGLGTLTAVAASEGWELPAAGTLADAYTTRGDYEEALRWWDRAVDAGRSVWALAQRATLRRRAGDRAGADADLAEALRLEPEDVADAEAVASALFQAARFAEAAERYGEVARVAPDNTNATLSQASSLYLAGDLETALDLIENVLVHAPSDPWARQMLGSILVDSGSLDDGVIQLERAAQAARDRHASGPFVTDLTVRLVDALCEQGRVVEAWHEACRTARDDPDDPAAWGTAASVAAYDGAWGLARRLAARGTRCSTRRLETYRELGLAAERDGDAEAALAAYALALELEAEDIRTMRGRANALWLRGGAEAARAAYQAVIDSLPSVLSRDRRTRAIEGWCRFRLGEYQDAAVALQDALSAMRFPANALFDLTLVALAAGSPSQADAFGRRGAQMAASEPEAYRRGTLRGALADLVASRPAFPDVAAAAADAYEGLLREALSPVDVPLTLPDDPWWADQLA